MLKIKRIYRPPVFDTATTFVSTNVKHKMNILYVSVFRKSGALHSALSGNTLGVPWLHITSVYLTEKKDKLNFSAFVKILSYSVTNELIDFSQKQAATIHSR